MARDITIKVAWQCDEDETPGYAELDGLPTPEFFTGLVGEGIRCVRVEPGGGQSDGYFVTLHGPEAKLKAWYTGSWGGELSEFQDDILMSEAINVDWVVEGVEDVLVQALVQVLESTRAYEGVLVHDMLMSSSGGGWPSFTLTGPRHELERWLVAEYDSQGEGFEVFRVTYPGRNPALA